MYCGVEYTGYMKENHILIVENDPLLTQSLRNHCKHKGLCADFSPTISKAMHMIDQINYAVVVIDRKLDDGDGLELVEYLSDCKPQTKVLVCSQLRSEHERISGLAIGADAYLPKPFSFTEFSLMLQKLLNVHKKIKQDVLVAGTLQLNPNSGIVAIGTETFKLRKKESQLLACLIIHKGSVVSRAALIEYVWGIGDEIPTHNTLDVYIRRIRMTLGCRHGHLIKTVRSFGYLLKPE